jgi:hypothetical protein
MWCSIRTLDRLRCRRSRHVPRREYVSSPFNNHVLEVLLTNNQVGTWFAFKYALRRKAIKLERTNLNYGALARLTRDGGFWIVLIIRLSAIPAHFSTAVFSTCDVNFFYFVIATLLSLPKQIFLVYLGVLLLQENSNNFIKTAIFGAVFVMTIVMAGWIWYKMRNIKKTLLEEQDSRRVERMKREEKEASFERQQAEFARRQDDTVQWI